MGKKPNILLIMADQLTSFATGCYGNTTVKTPFIDSLAKDGVVFENAYCNSPLCAPSRASMCTGRLPSTLKNYDNGTELPAHVPTFMHHLRYNDYKVALSGKMHFVGPDQYHGFEKRLTTDIYPSSFKWTRDWSAPIEPLLNMTEKLKSAGPYIWTEQLDYDEEVHFRALEQIRHWREDTKKDENSSPWCLCVSYTHPHDPPFITKEWWALYEDVEIDMPSIAPEPSTATPEIDKWLSEYLGLDKIKITEEEVNLARRGYYAMTSYFDAKVGDLIKTLNSEQLLDDTIVILTSDHGEMLGEHDLWFKRTFRDAALRVPFGTCQ